jgi:hypothetical protein
MLDSDSTIITVYPSLTHPRDYMGAAVHKMRLCNREHGNASIRIGRRGSGQKPCYRISFKDHEGSQHIVGSWWDNGDPLPVGDAMTYNWCDASVEFKDVLQFWAEQTGYKGPLK